MGFNLSLEFWDHGSCLHLSLDNLCFPLASFPHGVHLLPQTVPQLHSISLHPTKEVKHNLNQIIAYKQCKEEIFVRMLINLRKKKTNLFRKT